MTRSLFLLLPALLVGCKSSSDEGAKEGAAAPLVTSPNGGNPFAASVDAVVEGRQLYLQYGCSGCHGMSGGGGMGKPILDDEWVFGSDDATLFKLIRGEVPKQTMPNAIGKALNDEQIWKLLVYVRHLYQGDKNNITWTPPPPVPEERLKAVPATAGDPIAAGKVLFQATCSPCHGQMGRGDGPNSVGLNPKPRNLTEAPYMTGLDDRYLFELISRGGIAVGKSMQMPAFPMPTQDIGNVIAYVKTLSRAP